MSLTLRTTATAACNLCPLFRRALPTRSRPQVEMGTAVLGSLVVGTSFWAALTYLVFETLF